MDGLFNFLEKTLMTPMTKVSQLKYIKAIMGAGLASVAFTIVGSMFLVINSIPTSFPETTDFFEATFFRVSAVTGTATTMSLGAIALYFTMATAYSLAEEYQNDGINVNPLNSAFLALFGFLMTTIEIPFADGRYDRVTNITDEMGNHTVQGLYMEWGNIARFGGAGVFVAIIVALLTTEIYRFCMQKNITIKMPPGVPEGVSRSFAALIPAFFVAFTILFIQGLLIYFGWDIHTILNAPFGFLAEMVDSWAGLMVIIIITISLWAVGIHGSAIVSNILAPILFVNMIENDPTQGVAAGNIIAGEFLNSYVWIGGSGGTLGLAFILAFATKSSQLKVIGRSSIIPGFFNINEPIIFGVPLVYNPFLIIPFFLAPMTSGTIAYFSTALGFADNFFAAIPWTSPPVVGAFVSSGGNAGAALTALVALLVSAFIWYPFVKLYDAKLYKEQQESAAETTTA